MEVLTHGVEDGLAAGYHLIADVALRVERVALGRVQAEVCTEVGHVFGLLQCGPVGVAGVHVTSPSLLCDLRKRTQGRGIIRTQW